LLLLSMSADLKHFLPPPSQLGRLALERGLQWDKATDFLVQGTELPQDTAPSSAAAAIDDAGFQSGAGDVLVPKGGGPPVHVDVASFDSSDGATQAQSYLHEQDLLQPCYAACTVDPQELSISSVPGAKAVHQVPLKGKLPPNAGNPFEAYAAEFTIGSNLFYAYASGSPGDIPPQIFEKGVTSFYKYANQQSG
jgi:hypothetical protein